MRDSMDVITVDLDTLHEDPANARLHNERNLQAIAASLKQFGQVEPLVVHKNTGKVIGGNGRLQAMRGLGWTRVNINQVDIDDTQATALGIALNRTSEMADWNNDHLSALLGSLAEQDFDVKDIGFDEEDLKQMARQAERDNPQESDDTLDEMPGAVEARCQKGDLWIMGRHRLICGDATVLEHMDRLFDGAKADLLITDPPYGLEVVGGNHALSPKERLAKGGKVISNDGVNGLGILIQDAFANVYLHSREGACWYVWAPANADKFMAFATILMELEVWRHSLVWVKNSLVMGRADYHYRHEHCFYGWKPGKHMPPPDRSQDTVWEMDRPSRSEDHPTMKPIALMERCIKNSSIKGDIVLDPFCGSGTTLLACEKMGRACRALELSPKYCDVILKRWESATGLEAQRQEGSIV